jgi:hypothetical protein
MSRAPATQIASFHLDAPLVQVLPLFTAEGERSWAPGWDPEILSGQGERGSVFRTRDETGVETTWIVTEFDPSQGRASYARLKRGSNIGLVDVVCSTPAGGGTDVSVRYTVTGTSPEGVRFVDDFLKPDSYREMIEEWHTATAAILAKQKSLKDQG